MATKNNDLMSQLSNAHATIKEGQSTGNQATVDKGMAEQSAILAANGIIYPTGRKGAGVDTSTTPLPKSWGGTGIVSSSGSGSSGGFAGATSSGAVSSGGTSYKSSSGGSKVGAIADELKGLYSSSGQNAVASQEEISAIISELKNLYSSNGESNQENTAYIDELKGLYGENGLYASALAALQEAQRANVEKTVGELEGQKQDTNRSYADLFQQLYTQKMNTKKNIDQQMAAQGVTGGAAETTLLGLETNYSDALRRGEQARIDALGDLDQAITAARADGALVQAQMAADDAKVRTAGQASVLQNLLNRNDNQWALKTAGYASVLQSLLNRSDNQQASYASVLQSLLDFYENQRATQDAYQREDAANEQSYARQLALSIAQGGNMPTDELLAAAGMTKEDAQAIMNSATTGGTETVKPLLTAAQTLSALESGVVNDSTLAAYEYWYGQPWQQASDVVDTGGDGGKGYDNGTLTAAQVKQLQNYYKVTPDGLWGANSQKAAGGLSADAAWKAYQAAIDGGNDTWSGDLKTVNSDIAAGKFGTKIMEVQNKVRELVAAGYTAAQIGKWIDDNYSEAEVTGAGLQFIKYQLNLAGKGA